MRVSFGALTKLHGSPHLLQHVEVHVAQRPCRGRLEERLWT